MLFVSEQHNALVYDVGAIDAHKICHYIPDARRLHNGFVGVPRNLYNLQILAWLKYPIIEPMVDYDWPRNKVVVPNPFASQITTSNFLAIHPHSLCLNDPGTGKTLSALWTIDYLMARDFAPGVRTRALIVAPLSSLERTWGDAIFTNFMGRRSFAVVHGTEKHRLKQLARDVDFYIINHDGLKSGLVRRKRQFEITGLAEAIMLREDIQFVVFDEISKYRDGGNDRHRAGRVAAVNRKYVWGLTGTPTPNAPTDAYGVACLVNPSVGDTESFTAFKNRTMIRVNDWKEVPRPGAHRAAFELMRPCIRFLFEECVDIPEMLPAVTKQVEMTPEQKKYWRELRNELLLELQQGGGKISIPNQAALRNKLIQLSAGEIYDDKHQAHHIDCKPRLAALREAIEEAGDHKVLVFAPLTSVLDMLYSELSKEYSCVIINGKVSMKERGRIIQDFQTGDNPHVLLLDPATVAHSLNLTRANTNIWYVLTDKPEDYTQGNARIRRAGQRVQQRIIHIVSNKYEIEGFRRLADKQTMQDLVLMLVEGMKDEIFTGTAH